MTVTDSIETMNDSQKDNGFIDFYFHRLYITEPPRISSDIINPNELVRYLGLHHTIDMGKQLGQVMQSLLLFHEQKSVTIPSIKELESCHGLTNKEINPIIERMFFDTEHEPYGLSDLFFSHFRNHYDYIEGLAYLGKLLKENGHTDKTELTYEDDLDYILAFIAYSNEMVSFAIDKNHDNPMYHKSLPHDEVVQTVQDIIERVVAFRKEYEHDNATIPFGHEGGLKTNVAWFSYRYYLPLFYDVDDDKLTETERIGKQQQMILHHRDNERETRKFMSVFAGYYSVVYNPLLNKMFVWDYSREHMKDL